MTLRAHECDWPAVTSTKVSVGAVACPRELLPEQTMVPSLFVSPHVCAPPTARTEYVPVGGAATPMPPQQKMVPSILMPQVRLAAAPMSWNATVPLCAPFASGARSARASLEASAAATSRDASAGRASPSFDDGS